MFGDNYVVGTCYYPEHWDKSLWEEDLQRMLKAGITVIRIGEFAWSKIELTEGSFDFSFFDEFLDLCEKTGMKVIMGTPTATPPAWLTRKYPEVLNTDVNGLPYEHGGRRHYTYNSPAYRRLSAIIVEKMAEHYVPHPAVIGWQLDNEFNCEMADYYSPADQKAFRSFLQKRYGSLDALNEAWGTVFWNQTYTDWEEILIPGRVLGCHNPHQVLDYHRFVSDSTLSYAKMESDILRRYIKKDDFITTNGLFDNIDNHKMTKESLDLYMYDCYPSFAFGLHKDSWVPTNLKDRHWSRNLIKVRGVCPHFGIMEQQAGANGSVERMEGPAPRPGQLTLWAMQSVAHGADYISFFRWRTACIGSEIYWHGILDYDSRDNRKLAEVTDFAAKLRSMDEIAGADYIAGFAYLNDYDNEWDSAADVWHKRVDAQSKESVFLFSQKNHTPYNSVYLEEGFRAEELQQYPLVIYPHPVIMTEEKLNILRKYVSNGGTLLLGCRSGYKNENGHCVMLPQPGLLSELTGTDIHDFTFVHEYDEGICAEAEGELMEGQAESRLEMPLFNDILSIKDGADEAKVLARYDRGYYKGEPALVENRYGKGRVLHLGSCFSEQNLKVLFDYLGLTEPWADYVEVPEEVELAVRKKNGVTYLFLLNYMFHEEIITLKKECIDLFTGEKKEGNVTLKPFEVLVVRMD